MADVKWIKITTDIFSDEKILLLEQMPDADSLLVIWFKLLCMAGKENNYGVFLMRNRMPYTEEMLATIFRRPLNTVRLALSTFEAYGMIDIEDEVICIPNWEKHQNIEGLERVRELTRQRVAKHREKQKQMLLEDSNVTERYSNATDEIRIDKNRKEKNIENYSDIPELDEAIKEFIKFRKNAKKPMTDNAVKLLINKLNKLTTNVSEQIEILNQSIMNGWTGIYELKKDTKKPVNIGYQQSDVDDMPFFT